MEKDLFNMILQKPGTPGGAPIAPDLRRQFPEISFLPEVHEEPKVKVFLNKNLADIFAIVGVTMGSIAIVSWVVMAFGLFFSAMGAIFSALGLRSAYQKQARIGLILSGVAFVISVAYAIAAYNGVVNYNYFTNDLWG